MKIRSLSELDAAIDKELAWRKRELTTLWFAHETARDHVKLTMRRAGVALLYAHWEGFVKRAGTSYCEYVKRQGLRLRDASLSFLALGLRRQLEEASHTMKGRRILDTLAFIIDGADQKLKLSTASAVQTKSNLSAERFLEILAFLGLDPTIYQTKCHTVIEPLRISRNEVAHGHFLEIDEEMYHATA